MKGERELSESLKIRLLIVILIAGILLTSSTSMPLVNAQPTPTSLTIAVPSEPQGIPFSTECIIEATLKDENDNPLQNFDIDFLYACDDHTHLLWRVKTDSNGVASLKYAFPRNETWRISAVFSGTTNYAQSSSEEVLIMIMDYTPYVVGGGLVAAAIAGIAGYIVFRRRKKAITMPMTSNNHANDGERNLANTQTVCMHAKIFHSYHYPYSRLYACMPIERIEE